MREDFMTALSNLIEVVLSVAGVVAKGIAPVIVAEVLLKIRQEAGFHHEAIATEGTINIIKSRIIYFFINF